MTTFADSLKKEIARVARKELRDELAALRKTAALQRVELAAVKKQLQVLQSQLRQLQRAKAAGQVAPSAGGVRPGMPRVKPGRKVLFSPERLKVQRARLGFTQEQMAALLGVSSLSIWKWESGGATPRASRVPHILERLALSRREALALLPADSA